MTRVQFRLEEEALAFLRERGINPNERARDLLQAEVRRLQAEDRHRRLEAMRVPMPRRGEEMVREDRDGRERWRPL